MASDYGDVFGFRHSDESRRNAEGQYNTPVGGSSLLMGTCVEIDPSAPGFLRVGASNVAARPGICGLLLQEEAWDQPIYNSEITDSYTVGTAFKNRQSIITNGMGTKIWLKNRTGFTQSDGRVIPTVNMFVTTSVVVGAKLGWNGTAWAEVASASLTNAHMEVTYYDSTVPILEATLLV